METSLGPLWDRDIEGSFSFLMLDFEILDSVRVGRYLSS